MGEKSLRQWTRWERCERAQGAMALSRLADQMPSFFADSRLVDSNWSRLPFYKSAWLMELRFTRDHGVERAYVLHAPEHTWWLNGESIPIHEANEAESLTLTDSTVATYVRFFLYFVRGENDGFTLIESADEVSPRADGDVADNADGGVDGDIVGDVDDGDPDEDSDEILTLEQVRAVAHPLPLEQVRAHAHPLLARGVDEEGHWLFDATIAYAGVLFAASLAVDANGLIDMTDDEATGSLDVVETPVASPLELQPMSDSPGSGTDALDPEDGGSGAAAGGTLAAIFDHHSAGSGQAAGPSAGNGELFIGRTIEQDGFRRVLELARHGDGGPNEGHVVLIHGLGGIGKTTLLLRLHGAAGKSRRGGPVVAKIDCEQGDDRGNWRDYAGAGGPPIKVVLDRLYLALQESVETAGRHGKADRRLNSKFTRAFRDYREILALQPELFDRTAKLGVDPLGKSSQLPANQLAALEKAVAASAQVLETAARISGPHVSIPANVVTTTAQTAISIWRLRRDGRVDEASYNALLADLNNRLITQFADALREFSRHAGPVALFIDTGELLGEALELLREAAKRGGSRVVWVIGMRLEAESEAGLDSEATRFRRDIDSARLWSMPLARFDDRAVGDYLRGRLGERYPAELDIAAVAQFTHGVPLAVALFSQLLARGQDPALALAPVRDGEVSSVISDLVGRYLVHATKSPALRADLPLIYGLALLEGDVGRSDLPGEPSDGTRRDRDVLAALWGVPAPEVPDLLADLAKRHDFVLSDQHTLHQEVREAVLLFMLDQFKGPDVRPMSLRATELYRARLAGLGHATVDAQLTDQSWRTTMTALLRHTFWADLEQGLQLLKGIFAAAVAVDEYFADALLRRAAYFGQACTPEGQKLISDLRLITDLQLTFRPSAAKRARVSPAARDVLKALTASPAEPLLATRPPAAAYHTLFQASFHEAFRLTPYERAALLLQAATGSEPGSATADAITAQVHELNIDPEGYASAPENIKQSMVSAVELLSRLNPGNAIAHHDLGSKLFNLGRYEEAEVADREAVRLDPGNAIYQMSLGNVLSSLDRPEEAGVAYREALRVTPANAIARNSLGNTLFSLDRYDVAEAAYREAVRLDPADAVLQGNLAGALLELNQYQEAEAASREAVRLDPGNASYQMSLGTALSSLGQLEEAGAAYREALRVTPADAIACSSLGDSLFVLAQYDVAEAAYREAVRLDPDNAVLHSNLAGALSQLNRYEEAKAASSEAVRLDPGNADVHVGLGNVLFFLGRFPEGEAAYREALRLDPGNAEASMGLGFALVLFGRFTEGEAAYREAQRLAPGNAEVYNGLGYSLTCLGQFAEAETAYLQAQRLDPTLAAAYSNIGRLYLRVLGKADEAAVALREALRLEPRYANAHANLGSLYVVTGELDEARSSFLQATQSGPANYAFAELMLGALESGTDQQAAGKHFEAALAESAKPNFMNPFERAETKALTLIALNRAEEATAILRQALTTRSKAEVFQPRHYALFNTANITPLIDIWQEIIAKDPAAAGPWGPMPPVSRAPGSAD